LLVYDISKQATFKVRASLLLRLLRAACDILSTHISLSLSLSLSRIVAWFDDYLERRAMVD